MSRPEAEALRSQRARYRVSRRNLDCSLPMPRAPASQRDWVGEREESNDPYVRSYARRSSVDRNPGVLKHTVQKE